MFNFKTSQVGCRLFATLVVFDVEYIVVFNGHLFAEGSIEVDRYTYD